MQCPSCNSELSGDPVDATKVVCYACRKRYPADKVAQYWDEKARLENNRVSVGMESYEQKQAELVSSPITNYPGMYVPTPPVAAPPMPSQQYAPAGQYPYPQHPTTPQNINVVPSYQMQDAVPTPVPQQHHPAAGYYQQPGYYNTDAIGKKITGTAIGSMVSGILSIFVLHVIFGIAAIVCGIISIHTSHSSYRKNNGMAIAGIITGSVGIVVQILTIVLAASVLGVLGAPGY